MTSYKYFYSSNKPESKLTLYGNVEIRQMTLSFQVSGKIKSVMKEEGDVVKKGEIIATLNDEDYQTALEKATALVKETFAVFKDASTKYQKNAPLCRQNVLAQQDFDTLLKNKDQAEAAYLSAVASEKIAKNQLEYTKMVAPENGIVTTRINEPGTVVAAGYGVYVICKNKPMWVRAYVDEPNLGNIKYGMNVRISTDSIDPKTNEHRTYSGKIGYISPVAEFTPKTVQSTDHRANLVYKIRVYIDNIDDFLRQGMPTTITIDLNSK